MLFQHSTQVFYDRADAGKQLAARLSRYALENPVILALPRGGVPIGYQIAKLLLASLNVIIVKKVGLPSRPEFGIGAVSEEGTHYFDEKMLSKLEISQSDLHAVTKEKMQELNERVQRYRNVMKFPDIKGRCIILVDDGLATGVSAITAIKAVKKLKPAKIIFAAPVCAKDSAKVVNILTDNVLCLFTPDRFAAVGEWYQHFDQITDDEVLSILKKGKRFGSHSS